MDFRRAVLCAGLLLSVQFAQAVNYNFLKNAPIADFNEQDVSLMEDNLHTALESLEDGAKSAWQNPATGNSGLAQPIRSFDKADAKCRQMRVVNRSKKHIAENFYDFCKDAGGWKLSQ